MNVIYLDLEGVVVTTSSIMALQRNAPYNGMSSENFIHFVDKVSLGLVCKVAASFSASICISSTLRGHEWLKASLEELIKGYGVPLHKNWKTSHQSSREEEILKHVADNGVTNFAVVDDRKLDIKNFVRTNQRFGFDLEAHKKVVDIFDADNTFKYPIILL